MGRSDADPGASAFAARAVDVRDLAEAAKARVAASYAANTVRKTNRVGILRTLKVVANRDNLYRVKHYDVIVGNEEGTLVHQLEYGHVHGYRGKDGEVHQSVKRTPGRFIVTKAYTSFPGVRV